MKRNNESGLLKFAVKIFVLGIIVIALLFPFSELLKKWSLEGKNFTNNFPGMSFFYSKAFLYKQNQNLENQVAVLQTQVSDRKLLEDKLQDFSSFEKVSAGSLAAEVLTTPGSSIYDVLTISAGSDQSVKQGDIIYSGNTKIGFISKVFSNISEATLFSSPGEKISATIYPEGITLDIDGIGGGLFEALLPKGQNIDVGDLAVDLKNKQVMGIIESVSAGGNNSFNKLIIRTPVNPFELKWVSVAIK